MPAGVSTCEVYALIGGETLILSICADLIGGEMIITRAYTGHMLNSYAESICCIPYAISHMLYLIDNKYRKYRYSRSLRGTLEGTLRVVVYT